MVMLAPSIPAPQAERPNAGPAWAHLPLDRSARYTPAKDATSSFSGGAGVYGTYLDEVLMMRNAAGTKYYYHTNHLYSVHAITNQSGAIVEAVSSYDAYGKPTILTGAGTDATWFTGDDVVGSVSAIGNPWFYTGQRLDAETGLMYYKNRYYSAELGRFVGRDPIGYGGGISLYCAYYVPQDLDPFGLYEFVSRKKIGWSPIFIAYTYTTWRRTSDTGWVKTSECKSWIIDKTCEYAGIIKPKLWNWRRCATYVQWVYSDFDWIDEIRVKAAHDRPTIKFSGDTYTRHVTHDFSDLIRYRIDYRRATTYNSSWLKFEKTVCETAECVNPAPNTGPPGPPTGIGEGKVVTIKVTRMGGKDAGTGAGTGGIGPVDTPGGEAIDPGSLLPPAAGALSF